MGKQFLKKQIALLLVFSVLLSFALAGCGDLEETIQNIVSDYVNIKLDHTLLSESSDNEVLYTFQINAEISNNIGIDLTGATLRLDVPDDVEIVEGWQETICSIANEEVETYTWQVAIKPTEEDRNVEYTVTLSFLDIQEISSYESLFVDGRNANDNRLDFDADTWRFENYSVRKIPLLQEDYDALLINLSNSERKNIETFVTQSFGGQCYGMAVTAILAKTNRLDLDRLQDGASNLHAIKKNDKAKSIIGYYFVTQIISPARDLRAKYYADNDELKKLEELIKLSKEVENGGTPVLLCFKTVKGGHAVVAYGHETCKEEYNGTTYKNRILIYDNNFPKHAVHLYYTKDGKWEILYKENGSFERPYDTTILGMVTTSMEVIDISNADKSRESAYSHITSYNNKNLEISDDKTTWTVNGTDTNGAEGIVAYYNEGAEDDCCLNISIKRDGSESAYTVSSQNTEDDLDVSISYDNFYIAAKVEGDDQVSFSPNGSVGVEGETTNYNLSVTANDGYAPLFWTTVAISAKNSTNPKLETTGQGYILSGENLGKVTVYAEHGSKANELTVPKGETTVLLSQEGGNLCAKTDEDQDGQYETVLAVGKEVDPRNPLEEKSFFRENMTWILVAAGTVAAVAITVGIIVLCRKKKSGKKKVKYDFDDDVF